MFKTREISIGPVFRILIGVLGIFGIAAGLILAASELWLAWQGEWLRCLPAAFLLFIAYGGGTLLRSAIRGRLSVRSYPVKRKE